MPKKIKRQKPTEKRRAEQERVFREHHKRQMHLISLSTQSTRKLTETKALSDRLEASTKLILSRLDAGLPVSKEHAFKWLDLREQVLRSSIDYWLIEEEVLKHSPHSPEEREYLQGIISTNLLRRRQRIAVVEDARQKLRNGMGLKKVMDDMLEGLDLARKGQYLK